MGLGLQMQAAAEAADGLGESWSSAEAGQGGDEERGGGTRWLPIMQGCCEGSRDGAKAP